jgi:hypothetical protein
LIALRPPKSETYVLVSRLDVLNFNSVFNGIVQKITGSEPCKFLSLDVTNRAQGENINRFQTKTLHNLRSVWWLTC